MATMKRALVIGGATPDSIGAAIAERLLELGLIVTVPNQWDLDVRKDATQYPFAENVRTWSPDYVVYSAGINELDWIYHLSQKTFEDIMEVNVWGFINVIKGLQLTGRAYSVLAVTSDAAVRPMRTSIAYCASKAALNMAIRVASRELAQDGWRINGIAPGKVEGTAMTRYVDERVVEIRGWTPEFADHYEVSNSPIKRPVTTREVALVAADVLLSDSLAWTGDIISVNGGR